MSQHFSRRASAQVTSWRLYASVLFVGLALHLVYVGALSCQAVRGTILDAESLQPVRDVTVLVDGSTTNLRTDSTGSFSLRNLERGTHVLVFLKNEYSPRTFSFFISNSNEDEVDVGALLLSSGPPPTAIISGTVIDGLTGLPVLSAQVLVNGEFLGMTDAFGTYRFPSVPLVWGSNILEFRRVGYEPKHAELWTARESVETEAEIQLTPLAVRMSEVVVEGERTTYHFGQMREFIQRSRSGLGYYITRQDIEKRQPLQVSDLLWQVPGVLVSPSSLGGTIRILRGGGCEPSWFLDGILLNPSLLMPLDISIDDVLDPNDIEGIEVYKGAATTPVEFNTMFTGCGAIAIWTRR